MNETVIIADSKELHFSYIPPTLCTLILLVLLHFYHETSHKAKLGNQIPGPRAIPFFGNVLLILGLKSPHHIFKRTMKLSFKYGRVIRGWAGWKLFVFIMDPTDAEVILNSQVHIEKSDDYHFFRPWLGNGILISSGNKWRTHRKLIAQTFHMNILKSFVPTFNENSKRVVEKLKFEVGKEIDCHDYMSETTVILQTSSFLVTFNPLPLLLTKLITENDKIVKILIFDKSTPVIDDLVSDVIKRIAGKPLEVNLVRDFSAIARNFNDSVILLVDSLENFKKFGDGVKDKQLSEEFPLKFVVYCELAVIRDWRKLPLADGKIK